MQARGAKAMNSMSTATRAPVRVNPVLQHPAERRTSLSGTWRFRLDPGDEGIARGWFDAPGRLDETLSLIHI